MANATVPKRDCYVYVLYREDGTTPFYVGFGTNRRWLIHERDAHKGESRKDRIIMKMRACGFQEIPKKKLAEGLTRAEAAAIEISLIARIGRAPDGPLVNHTRGGDGAADLSEEVKAKKAAANRINWADPIVREKRSNGMKAVWTPEKRDEHGAKLKEQRKSQEYRIKVSRGIKVAWGDPIFRAKQITRLTSPESIAARARGSVASWADPEKRARRIEGMTDRKHSEETKAKMCLSRANPESNAKRTAAIRKNWDDPEYRATHTARLKATTTDPLVREKLSLARKGRKHSAESIAKMSATAYRMGNWIGRKHSMESRAKMSKTRKQKSI